MKSLEIGGQTLREHLDCENGNRELFIHLSCLAESLLIETRQKLAEKDFVIFKHRLQTVCFNLFL